jgi:HEAT repeat protein
LAAADTPGWRVALINALAERREPSHLSFLIRESVSDVEEVRTAAVIGLAKLGDGSAAAVIAAARKLGSPRARRIATDCYLHLADALSARGNKAAALGIYREMLAAEGWLKCAALIGIGRTGSEVNLPIFFSAAADDDPQVRGACVDALCLLQGKNVRAAIVAQLKTAKPQAKLALLQSLARLGEKSALAVFMTAATDPDQAVRMAAIAGLGRIGDSTSVPLLLKAAAAGKLQETARQSLQTLSGGEIDSALLDAMDETDPKTRVEAVRALSARHSVAATSALLKAAADVDASVRNESLKALGAVAPSDALPALAALLVNTEDDGIRNEAGNSLVKIANRDPDIERRSEPILQALGSSHGAARFSLLSVLGRIGGQKSLEGVRAAVKDSDEKVRDAAIRALCEWPDALAAEDLLAIAKSPAGETHQVLAIRGYIRVCSIRTDRPQAETAKLLATGLATAKRPEEKRQALGSLAEVRDILALKTVAPCMNDNALREEAASAAFRIGRDIWNDHPQAVKAAMRKVLEVSTNDGLKGEATEVLNHAEQKLREAGAKK